MLDQSSIDAIRNDNILPRGHLIDGKICQSTSGETAEVISPINGRVLTTTAAGNREDANRAIAAARSAFEDRQIGRAHV